MIKSKDDAFQKAAEKKVERIIYALAPSFGITSPQIPTVLVDDKTCIFKGQFHVSQEMFEDYHIGVFGGRYLYSQTKPEFYKKLALKTKYMVTEFCNIYASMNSHLDFKTNTKACVQYLMLSNIDSFIAHYSGLLQKQNAAFIWFPHPTTHPFVTLQEKISCLSEIPGVLAANQLYSQKQNNIFFKTMMKGPYENIINNITPFFKEYKKKLNA